MNALLNAEQVQYDRRLITEARLANSKRSDWSRILRFAVANLLRKAHSELDDARAVLARGSQRSALVLAEQAFGHIVAALAALEHGWPLEEWNAGLRAVPEANPLQPDLAEVEALVRQNLSLAVQADGQLAGVSKTWGYAASWIVCCPKRPSKTAALT